MIQHVVTMNIKSQNRLSIKILLLYIGQLDKVMPYNKCLYLQIFILNIVTLFIVIEMDICLVFNVFSL